jgi:hypothetical protein
MFDINSQRTKAGNGSNLIFAGARVFQLSQLTVPQKITKKKPILPTCVVIQRANFLTGDKFSL